MGKGAALVCLLSLVGCVWSAVPKDEITALPGWDAPLPSRQYSGYLAINANKRLHYWMVTSEGDPKVDPVVLWLNGGPGCSSLDGLVYEHGPFRINATDPTKLVRFDYTWAKVATMIYLEAPVGVGFSYSLDKDDYNTNDDKTAQDNLAAVEKFFELYPEYKANPFFITGESYAGVYVPTLAEAVMWAMGNGTYTGAPLKGIAVGNGCTGNSIGSCGGERTKYDTEYLLGQAFVPKHLKDEIVAACDWSKPVTTQCETLVQEMGRIVGNIDLYNIYGKCISGSEEAHYGAQATKAPISPEGSLVWGSHVGGPNACINSILASAYLNQPSVMNATHVVKQPFRWATCANQIHYTSNRPNLPRDTYPDLIKHFKVLVYNGDWDACVPYTDNEAWTEGMGYAVAKAWHPWTYDDTQVGGYATVYQANDFTFITVRGGRHEVPETAPEKAFELIKRFTSGRGF